LHNIAVLEAIQRVNLKYESNSILAYFKCKSVQNYSRSRELSDDNCFKDKLKPADQPCNFSAIASQLLNTNWRGEMPFIG